MTLTPCIRTHSTKKTFEGCLGFSRWQKLDQKLSFTIATKRTVKKCSWFLVGCNYFTIASRYHLGTRNDPLKLALNSVSNTRKWIIHHSRGSYGPEWTAKHCLFKQMFCYVKLPYYMMAYFRGFFEIFFEVNFFPACHSNDGVMAVMKNLRDLEEACWVCKVRSGFLIKFPEKIFRRVRFRLISD